MINYDLSCPQVWKAHFSTAVLASAVLVSAVVNKPSAAQSAAASGEAQGRHFPRPAAPFSSPSQYSWYPSPNLAKPAPCAYWCGTPNGRSYCCGRGGPPKLKPGFCPTVRPNCPNTIPRQKSPKRCTHDNVCPTNLKCCYDRCFRGHLCKPPVAPHRLATKRFPIPFEQRQY